MEGRKAQVGLTKSTQSKIPQRWFGEGRWVVEPLKELVNKKKG